MTESPLNKIKRMDIRDILDRYSIKYRHVSGKINFSIRNEKNPSCFAKISNSGRWIWRDFGTSEGGTVVDLVMAIEGCTVQEVPKIIGISGGEAIPKREIPSPKSNKLKIEKVQPINTLGSKLQGLLWHHRRLTVSDLDKFSIKTVTLNITNKKGRKISRLGVQNKSKGWELFDIKPSSEGGKKVSMGPKDITVWRVASPTKIVIAESVFDIIALYKMRQRLGYINLMEEIYVALNGVSNAKKFVDWYNDNYAGLPVYDGLDNDSAGRQCAEIISKNIKQCLIEINFTEKDPCDSWVKMAREDELERGETITLPPPTIGPSAGSIL